MCDPVIPDRWANGRPSRAFGLVLNFGLKGGNSIRENVWDFSEKPENFWGYCAKQANFPRFLCKKFVVIGTKIGFLQFGLRGFVIDARMKTFGWANETGRSGRKHLFLPCGVASRANSPRLYYGS